MYGCNKGVQDGGVNEGCSKILFEPMKYQFNIHTKCKYINIVRSKNIGYFF